MEWNGLNRFGPHKLMCLKAWPTESDTIRRCGLVEVDVALWEEVCHWGWSLGFQGPSGPSVSLLLPSADPDVKPSVTFLSEWCYASLHDDNGLNL